MKRRETVLLLSAILLFAAAPGAATTISITGSAGADGADGADGDPGEDGAAGSDGQDVTAIADALGESNTATARGGDGGAGGDGGDGVPAGADAGSGGDGGAGGDAIARAIVTGASSSTATATGGFGGSGGDPGSATDPGLAGAPGAGGTGGNALAEATLVTDLPLALAIATSRAIGEAGTGDATSTASASGGGAVNATARAFVGDSTASGGVPTATAEGHSTGGGPVYVEASVSRVGPTATPIDIILDNAVTGSTAGLLGLRQGVNALAGSPGDAINTLVATNPGGGALVLEIGAQGGIGSDTVLGDILATSTTGQAVSIYAYAGAAQGGGRILQENRSPSAPPTPSQIHAVSNGGEVLTSVHFQMRDPSGAPIEMVDVATGDTTGALTLEQTAEGYREFPFSLPGDPIPPPGLGGAARSSLTKHTASSELELRPRAYGGLTGSGAQSNISGSGGNAAAIADGSNSAGAARVYASAFGGSGYEGAVGGDADLEAKASTTGDGHEVVIGYEIGQDTSSGYLPIARGGDALCITTCMSGVPLARGGDARSTSTGIAEGDSPVTVFDAAVGGSGGRSVNDVFSGVDGVTGDGGHATSSAAAIGAGVSTVKARSDARGGPGGYRVSHLGHGGNADATASAIGLGRVEAWAHAAGGDSVWEFAFSPLDGSFTPVAPFGPAGSAIAHASADGASGFARAEALTGFGELPRLRAQSEAQVGSQRDVAAATTHGGALASAPSDPGLEGSAFLTGAPLAEDVATARAGNAAFEGTDMLALAHWTGDAGDGPLTLSTDLEIAMNTTDSANKLVLGAFALSVVGDGFESLSLSLTKNGFSQRSILFFDTAEEVIAFFTGSVLDLGVGWEANDEFVAHFDLALGAGTRFEMGLGYATAVPEPGTGLLIVLGLLVFAHKRRITAFGLIRPTSS